MGVLKRLFGGEQIQQPNPLDRFKRMELDLSEQKHAAARQKSPEQQMVVDAGRAEVIRKAKEAAAGDNVRLAELRKRLDLTEEELPDVE